MWYACVPVCLTMLSVISEDILLHRLRNSVVARVQTDFMGYPELSEPGVRAMGPVHRQPGVVAPMPDECLDAGEQGYDGKARLDLRQDAHGQHTEAGDAFRPRERDTGAAGAALAESRDGGAAECNVVGDLKPDNELGQALPAALRRREIGTRTLRAETHPEPAVLVRPKRDRRTGENDRRARGRPRGERYEVQFVATDAMREDPQSARRGGQGRNTIGKSAGPCSERLRHVEGRQPEAERIHRQHAVGHAARDDAAGLAGGAGAHGHQQRQEMLLSGMGAHCVR